MGSRNGKPVELSLCMVVRDCADTLEPLLKKLKPYVDEMIFVLGGQSVDRTEKICKRYGDVVIPFTWEWDWSAARNEALKHVSGRWWMWLDGDDDIDKPEEIPNVLRKMEQEGWHRCDLTYLYRVDEQGNVRSAHNRERILRTEVNGHRWYWKGRVHELPFLDTEHSIGAAMEPVITHKRSFDSNSSERNLPIMLDEWKEGNHEARLIFHIANAFYSLGKFDEAQTWFNKYLDAPENDVLQWGVNCMIARCCKERHDWIGLESHAQVALGLFPDWKDPYLLMAYACYWGRNDAGAALKWLDNADRAGEAPLVLFRLVEDYTLHYWDLAHRVYARLEQWQKALDFAMKGWQYLGEPQVSEWRNLIEFYDEAQRADKTAIAAIHIADHLTRRGDLIRAKQFLSYNLPQTVTEDRRIVAAKNRLDQLLIGVTDAEHAYEEHDTDFTNHDVMEVELPRFQWYVERLRARGCETVLEVGCHNGDISRGLARAGFKVTAIDFNPKVISTAHALAVSQGLDIDFRVAKLEEIEETFDAVLFAEVLEHMAPKDQMNLLSRADKMARVVLGSVPAEFLAYNRGLFEDDPAHGNLRGHVVEFSQDDLETLILTDYERRIVNCHKILSENWVGGSIGFGNRVFEYDFQTPTGQGISFWLGEGFEPWSPESIDGSGIGGSETAAVRLAEELANLGHRVVVYASAEGVWNGVVYRHASKFNPQDERDVLVVSRAPQLCRERPNARRVILWSHDVDYGLADGSDLLTEEVARNIDEFVVMSEWQKAHWADRYPFIETTVIGNAITVYPVEEERKRHRFIWSSSADRGLDEVLLIWPYIKEMWEDAELHVFYGFNTLNAMNDPARNAFRNQILRKAREPGVFLHGRVGQKQLAQEYAKAQFWLYPSMRPGGEDWHETFCIAAAEAQAYGCQPLTRRIGALPERVHDDEAFVDDWHIDTVTKQLEKLDAGWPVEFVVTSVRQTWPFVAQQWQDLVAEPVEA